jgi:flagellar biosynthesis/type III secretory pathway chaperone
MNDDARRRLEDVLDHEIEVARALAATLRAERAALTGPSAAELERQAAAKTDLLRVLERLEDERRGLAFASGQALPGTRLAAGTGLASTVAGRWGALMEIISGCRTANEVNGYIANLRRGQVQQLLGAVRGVSLNTYNSQGKTFSRALKELAKA